MYHTFVLWDGFFIIFSCKFASTVSLSVSIAAQPLQGARFVVACDWTNFDVPLLEEDRKASAFGVLLTNQRNGMPYIYICWIWPPPCNSGK